MDINLIKCRIALHFSSFSIQIINLPVWISVFLYSKLGINSKLYKIEQQLVLNDLFW